MSIGFAEKVARQVHSEYVVQLPVDPIDVAKRMGIHASENVLGFISDEFNGASGVAYIDQNTGQRVILVESSDAPTRKRFTAAHELGHHVLNHTQNGHMFRDTLKPQDVPFQRDICEVEANRFAAELLMPASRVEAAFRTNYSVSDLARYFGVSEAAMTYRLKGLGLVR